MAVLHAILARLRAAGLNVYDTTTPGRPPGPYLVVADDTGRAAPHRLGTAPHWTYQPVSVMCVARTPDGCRDLTHQARVALTGWRPHTAASPLRESETSPLLVDGVSPGERYYSMTIRYHTTTLIEEAIRP